LLQIIVSSQILAALIVPSNSSYFSVSSQTAILFLTLKVVVVLSEEEKAKRQLKEKIKKEYIAALQKEGVFKACLSVMVCLKNSRLRAHFR
jgi:hypothetical protein